MSRKSWPWPADTPLDRARRAAASYRAALVEVDPEAAQRIDEWLIEHGQPWVQPDGWLPAADDLLTLAEAAMACRVELRTIYTWHQRGLPYVDTPKGPRVRGDDLIRWHQLRRQARLRRS